MRSHAFCLFTVFVSFGLSAQLIIPKNSVLYGMKSGDSVVVYQCHVKDPSQEPRIASDSPVTYAPHTVTDRFVLRKQDSAFVVSHWQTGIRDFPNRKFSGLKIRERPYWYFMFVRSCDVSAEQIKKLVALEQGGREAMEYDYPVTRYTRNQLILKKGKNFSQLVLDKGGLVSDIFCR